MNGLILCFISDEKNIMLSAYQREFLKACCWCDAVCFCICCMELGVSEEAEDSCIAYEGSG